MNNQKPLKINVKKGALHEALGMRQNTPIPTSKLESLKDSNSPLMRERANFALNARQWNH